MKIAYGIHGYGRGHASRALAVLPELASRHELLLLAGGDAYEALRADYPVARIPVLRYQLGRGGRRRRSRTLGRAIPSLLDLRLHGPGVEMVCEALADFAPDIALSDSEAWTHRAARRLGIPRISFDHFGVLVYCRWPVSWGQRPELHLERFCYHWLMAGEADRHVIVSFYAPPPTREGICVVGPVLRDVVRQAEPERGDYLLVYFSHGHIHFTPRVEAALKGQGLPVVVYGTGREGTDANLAFRPPSNTRFVADLAGSRAVFATAGNQLISEALFLRTPLLLLPEDALEQRLNATAIERMGVGLRTSRRRISAEQIRAFLADEPRFVARMPELADGHAQAVEAIERFALELTGKG